ncbi:hypothetical protein COCSUDRAFT_54703 [Coccomyxa subellipsoidea C-169]|uniref:Ribosome assembly protein 3 n=1 Tax=Coccomyxa subellipsoidea (strain C-169) TaxID=574566 RepID=I0YM49_COCSC|nr:hypothetical protein COCSUDRAFT_54703 [Coccomyxa subellipsoidea C-169]EIE19468.1 hypothetical protein COCSUDRAFT_54703 [Coccomyxa subellipsoidea C-169]|eukprot:XP_005644012.1 hypothetical protein COCSUDRAFT_54703 [Coccomyxa subellipsoidea C-169]
MSFEKFRDQQGLASIARALAAQKASQITHGGEQGYVQEKEQTENTNRRKKRRLSDGLPKGSYGAEHDHPSPRELNGADHQTQPDQKSKTRQKRKSPSTGAMTRQPDSLQQDRQQSDTLAATPLAEKQTSGSCAPVAGQKTFRDLYVQSFTAAFSTDLFKLQEVEGAAVKVDLLLRCIENGGDIFSPAERQLFGVSQRNVSKT